MCVVCYMHVQCVCTNNARILICRYAVYSFADMRVYSFADMHVHIIFDRAVA